LTTSPQFIGRAEEGLLGNPLSALVRASATLLATPELHAVLPKILDVAKEVLGAGAYAVWKREPDGTWHILHSQGLSPEYTEVMIRGHAQEYLTEPLLAEDVQRNTRIESRRALYQKEGIVSIMAMPLVADTNLIGTMTFYFKHAQRFPREMVDLARALANISAAAINTAELYEAQTRLRQHAVEDKKRADFLSEATVLLASSLDYQTTLNRVSEMAVPKIADWCSVFVVNAEGRLERTAVAHPDPKKLELGLRLQAKYPPSLEHGSLMYLVLQTGRSQYVPDVTEEMLVKAARSEEHLAMIRELGMRSALTVPIKSREGVLGVITLVTAESGRRLEPEDIRLAEDLATRAAAAIENARLYHQLQEELRAKREAEESLKATQARLLSAQAAAKLGAYELDVATGLLHWSPEIPSLQDLGWATMADWQAHIHPEDQPRLAEVSRTTPPGEEAEVEYRIIKPDGTVVWLLSRGRRYYDEQGRHVRTAGISLDITAQKLSEEALRRTEKLAAAGRLAATIAHEINNPLAAVTNLVFLAKYQSSDKEIKKLLDLAERELQRVSHITKQTLGFYRDTSTPRLIHANQVVQSVIDIYGNKISGRTVDIRTMLRAESPLIGLEGEVRQVISNVLSNAIDSAPRNSEIIVTSRDTRSKSRAGVLIKIADNGPGIPPEHRRRLFEAFFTTKRDVGTGLGLWVSKGIVEKHGGWIRVTTSSRPNRHGTVFSIFFPRATMPSSLKA